MTDSGFNLLGVVLALIIVAFIILFFVGLWWLERQDSRHAAQMKGWIDSYEPQPLIQHFDPEIEALLAEEEEIEREWRERHAPPEEA